MDVKAYMESGNLEQYCMELLNSDLGNEISFLRLVHPEINQELEEIEITLEKLAQSAAITPNANLKNKILAKLDFAGDTIDLDHLPPTTAYSNYKSWLAAVEHLIPAEPFDDFFAHPLQQTDRIAQTLVITRLNVPEELHEVVSESFFILKGTCTCTVGKDSFTLNAGDYLDIPLYTNHDIRIDSPYVVAILQHQFA